MNIDRIIDIIRSLKEDAAPTMSVGTGEKSLGYDIETGTPPVDKKKKKKKYIYGGKGSRKMWM